MKKSKKITIMCVVAFVALLVVLAIISNVKDKKSNKNNMNSTAINNQTSVNNSVQKPVQTSEDYAYISYKTETEEYSVEGTNNKISVNQSYATVEVANEEAKSNIQQTLNKIADDEFKDYKNQVETSLKNDSSINADFMNYMGNLSVSWSFVNSRIDNKVVSVKNQSSGSLGGVSWSNKRGYSFDAQSGKLLKIEDLSADNKNLKSFVNSEMRKHIKNNAEMLYIYDDIVKNVDKKVNIDDCTWYLSERGLTICFEKYKVSPDTFEYTITYEKLKDYMSEKYMLDY